MRILALIPARGGSKRLPRKNIKPLGGKPLIVWSIESARKIPDICDILVSTDDSEIAGISKTAGALVPWLRPDELSTDSASSIDVALHALNWYEDEHGHVEGLMLLQPTSPFRSDVTLKRAIELFLAKDHRPIIGVSPAVSHPSWYYKIEGDTLEAINSRFQVLSAVYVLNGSMYLTASTYLREKKAFFKDNAYPLIIENYAEALDIDTAYDFQIAECLAAGMLDSPMAEQ